MVRLIATDLDGTFLDSNRQVSDVNRAAVQECLEAGIIFCLASGRGISTMEPIAANINLAGPIVSSNGAYVTGLQGEDVHHFSVPLEARTLIVDYAEQNNIHLNCYERRNISFSQRGAFADMYVQRTGCNPVILDLGDIRTIEPTKLLYIDHPQNIVRYRAEIEPLLAPYGISVVISEPDYVEFLPPGINKGVGLQKLCQHLNIDQSEVAAIGDWWNDIEMVAWAGVSAAVANAAPEVKAVAKYHVPSNDQNGAADFVRAILKGSLEGILIA